MKDMKKEIKEYTDKSCVNCCRDCSLLEILDDACYFRTKENWYCCDYEPKEKTLKLYAYLKEDDGHELIWHTNHNLRIERFTRVPSEDKEIEI